MSGENSAAAAIQPLVAAARQAQARIEHWDQNRIDETVAAVGWHVLQPAASQALAEMAVTESGIGSAQDSRIRLETRVRGTLGDLHGITTIGVIDEDPALRIAKYARPIGVIAVLVPSTAPAAALLVNTLVALKTRNAVIVCPNPSAQTVTRLTVALVRQALERAGAPSDLLQMVESPTRHHATVLAENTDLVIATGGSATVERVRRTGTPTHAAGPGNAVVLVDATADTVSAIAAVVAGKTFDNGTSCSAESCLVLERPIIAAALTALTEEGVHVCSSGEADRLRATLWPDGKTLSRAVVGRPAPEVAALAGISVPDGTRALAAWAAPLPAADPFGGEKLCPVLGLYSAEDFPAAVTTAATLTERVGAGHSCALHTTTPQHIDVLARQAKVSRIMVNQSTGNGNTGSFGNGMPFTSTVSCGTWGKCTLTENVGWRQFLNTIWVSMPVQRPVPRWEDLMAPWTSSPRFHGLPSSSVRMFAQ